MKKIKGLNLKERTIDLLQRISAKEDDSLSTTVEKAIEFYAREKYGME